MTPDQVFDLLDTHMGRMFRWGKSDCFLSGADVFAEAWGIDVADQVRGTYSDSEGAGRILGLSGGFLEFVCKTADRHQLVRVEPSLASPGALGITISGQASDFDGRCLCICLKPGIWAAKSINGFGLNAIPEMSWHAP